MLFKNKIHFVLDFDHFFENDANKINKEIHFIVKENQVFYFKIFMLFKKVASHGKSFFIKSI